MIWDIQPGEGHIECDSQENCGSELRGPEFAFGLTLMSNVAVGKLPLPALSCLPQGIQVIILHLDTNITCFSNFLVH